MYHLYWRHKWTFWVIQLPFQQLIINKSVVQIMGILVEKKLLLILGIIIVTCVFSCTCLNFWLSPVQPDSHLTNHLHASGSPRWLLRTHCRRGGTCEIVRASTRDGGLEEVIKRMWLMVDLRAGSGESMAPHPCPCPWNVPSAHHSHSWSPFQGCSLESTRCCWDHLDWKRDWILLRPQYKLLWFWWAGAEINLSCSHPRPALNVSSVAYHTCHQPICLCLWSLLALPVWGPVSNFTWGSSWVLNQYILSLSHPFSLRNINIRYY